jgi:hypothetical protein
VACAAASGTSAAPCTIMDKKLTRPLAALPALLLSCATMDIRTDATPDANAKIATFRTFGFRPAMEDGAASQDPILDGHIRAALRLQLTSKGYYAADGSAPDFEIGWSTAVKSKIDVQAMDTFYGYGFGYTPDVSVRQYEQGTLVVNVIDRRSNTLIWRGVAQAEVSPNAEAAQIHERVNEAVKKMFERFPNAATAAPAAPAA